jgi:hypothetical protein
MGGPRQSFDSSSEGKVVGLLLSYFQSCHLEGRESKDPEYPGVCSCSREAFPLRTRSDKFPGRTPFDLFTGASRRGVPRLHKIVRERAIFLRSG